MLRHSDGEKIINPSFRRKGFLDDAAFDSMIFFEDPVTSINELRAG